MIYCSLCQQPLDLNDEWDVKYAICEPCHEIACRNIAREEEEGYQHWQETERLRIQNEDAND
jgi:hypothetical protein